LKERLLKMQEGIVVGVYTPKQLLIAGVRKRLALSR
jgi:hypothetical protein